MMGDRIVETRCHIGVLKANFFPHLYNTTPFPLLNVGFLPLSCTTLKRGREGGIDSQYKPDLK